MILRVQPARWRVGTLVFAIASTAAVAQVASAPASDAMESVSKDEQVIDRIVVTAQRKEEVLLDVPIAVSAFDADALDRKQITQATDLQLNVPNVAYTKGNFTGSNFQIRGIGVSSVGASSDSGVETLFNSVPIKNSRLFETEYFDIERVEVLRGPQGTLYGRNATGGAINVLPKKPIKGDFSGSIELTAGNYAEAKVKGTLNIPVGEALSMRFAGISYRRDGTTRNLFTGNDIDGRDQWAVRGAIRFQPSDTTDVTLTLNRYQEDSTRMRVGKQECHRDPTGAYGCLPDRLGFDAPNWRASLGGTLGELMPIVLRVPGAALIAPGTDVNQGAVVPHDLRTVDTQFDPTYKADETIATLELIHDFGAVSFTAITGYQETDLVSRIDYRWLAAASQYNGAGATLLFGGSVPLSQIDLRAPRGPLDANSVGSFSRSAGYDQSDQDAHQWSQEIRLASDFAGPFNFQLGAIYFDADDDNNYSIATTELNYAAVLLRLRPSIYNNATPRAALKSTAAFGELYWDMVDGFKWTAGLRWTQDKKSIEDRALLLSVAADRPLPDFRVDQTTFREFTGRFGFDWKPGWFDGSTIYAFYSRGYKAGGFNPPTDRTNPAFAGTPEVYRPEFIDAFEIGSKNVLAQGRMQANLSAFYYKYDALQVSKIVARTSVNENVSADIYGFEGEFVLQPTHRLQMDANLAYLHTRIEAFASIDPRDPTNGDPDFTVVKDVSTAANYVIPTAAIATARAADCLLPAALGGPFGLAGLESSCAPFFSDGVAANVSGNQLPLSPEWSIKIGAQYTFDFAGMKLVPRVDYYWRADFYTRIFNRPIDKVAAWDVLNAQVDLSPEAGAWYLRGYIANVMGSDNITGMYVTDASSALFTNVFALEPRTYGVSFGLKF
ncbi:MAG TPA: TonB-dependent receptor [Steroidobacteraceae bacterium]|jgi:outer membrane receptor protein involved in Fe transport